ncbi:MAG TPA: glycosyl hydrolase family 18 protein [Candidatus Dormibacteraeota bacterium]|nr:glycosyl hydrolase family 18 protein [Candidatus Dormibacteraeota bacterium]
MRRLIASLGLVAGLLIPPPLSAIAAPPAVTHADPMVGPNARDEARHAHDRLQLSPATTSPHPALPRLRGRVYGQAARANAQQGPAVNPAGGVDREVFGFAPYWAIANNSQWNYSLLTTVAYFGLDINSDGSINTSTNGWTGWNSQNLVNTINAAHAAGDRVVVVIKAFDVATINQIVNTPGGTQAAITNTINAIAAKNLDGVNVDFEGSTNSLYPDLQSGFTNFIKQLSSQVHQRWPQAMVSVDTYSGSASWDGGFFKIGDLAPNVDAFFIMAYDMAFGNMPGHAGANAPLNGGTYNDTLSVSQYLSKAPASKILLGVGYYGYKWSTVDNSPNSASSGGAEADTYAGVLSDLSCGAQSLTQSWDNIAASPWVSWYSPSTGDPCGGNHGSWRELYYDNAASLGDKYDLVNNNNLLGTGMWALGYDGTSQDLWNALRVKFGNPWPGQYHPVVPTRIYDTRNGAGRIGPWQTRTVAIAGAPGVPVPLNGVAAVTLNVTVVGASAPSYLTVYPAGNTQPATSNLNFQANTTVANLVDVTLGRNGAINLFNAAGSTDVVLDVSGWTSITGNDSDTAGLYCPLVPSRLLDTRSGLGGSTTVGPGQTISFTALNRGNVPSTGVAAVALNVTATNPSAAGYLTLFPGGGWPRTSSVNFTAGQTVPNRVIVGVGLNGQVSIFNGGGTVDVVVDVSGWFTDAFDPAATGGRFTGVAPARIIDTRFGTGGTPRAPVRAGAPLTVPVAGLGGVPAMSAIVPPRAVVVNVTVTNTSTASYLAVYPSDAVTPGSSDLNWIGGGTVCNLVLARLGADGRITLATGSGSADAIIDIVGWFN